MTRKHFVKALMARGYSRNTAAAMALVARSNGKSYAGAEQAMASLAALRPALQSAVETIGSALDDLRADLDRAMEQEANEQRR